MIISIPGLSSFVTISMFAVVFLLSRAPFDLIFIDAAKGQYPVFLREAERLLSDDGVIVADNVLFNGMVATGVPDIRRNKTIVKRLAEFLRELEADLSLKTVILPISDGVTVSVRIGGAER